MVIFVWLMALNHMRGELKCAEMMNGAQSVVMDGTPIVPEWFADNLVMKHKVCYYCEMYILA